MKYYQGFKWSVGAVVALGMALGGCDGKVDNGAGSASPVVEEALPSSLARSLCEGLATCCQSIGQVVNVVACETSMQDQLNLKATTDTTRYDPVLGGQCVADVRAALSSCYSLDDLPACETMFVGTVAPGGVCSSSQDCAPPANGRASCAYSSASGGSVCVTDIADSHGVLGQSCSGSCTSNSDGSSACGARGSSTGNGPPAGAGSCYTNDGLYCDSTTWTCQPLVEPGGPCTDSFDCVTSAMCDYTAGQCVPKGAVGAACAFSTECNPAAYCNADGSCQPKKSDGQTCSIYDECSGYCLMADEATSGTCASGRERFVPTPAFCQNPSLG